MGPGTVISRCHFPTASWLMPLLPVPLQNPGASGPSQPAGARAVFHLAARQAVQATTPAFRATPQPETSAASQLEVVPAEVHGDGKTGALKVYVSSAQIRYLKKVA